MPWRNWTMATERERFITAVTSGEASFSAVCAAYGVSRKTGYKWWGRYLAEGWSGLGERSRAPVRHPNATAEEVEALVIGLREAHPLWGPRKLKAWWEERHPEAGLPAASTLGGILRRAGLVVERRRRRSGEEGRPALRESGGPNAIWTLDFKGWFRTGDGKRVDPVTVEDHASRYLIRCVGVAPPTGERVRGVLEMAFREYGLPEVLRTDNGPPFASGGLGGLSRLGVWWIKLGIVPERIRPGHPEENGRHERLHRTLKAAVASPPARTVRAQQERMEAFRREYNEERPHEALGQTPPGRHYAASERRYPSRVRSPEYGEEWEVRWVRSNGEMKWRGERVFVSESLAGEPVGLRRIAEGRWEVAFGPVVLAEWWETGKGGKRRGLRPRTPGV